MLSLHRFSVYSTAAKHLITARSELRKVLFLAPSVCGLICLCMKYLRNGTAERICAKFTRKTCLVPRYDEFEVKVKGQGHQGQKRHFSALLAACLLFMFGKTSLDSSF